MAKKDLNDDKVEEGLIFPMSAALIVIWICLSVCDDNGGGGGDGSDDYGGER